MPATPTFIVDLPTLKARLRLSSVDTGDAAAVLDSVVEETRLMFFDELGATRVAALKAIVRVAAPTTDDELDRWRAENVELLAVRATLMRRLPMLFIQGSGQARKSWNDEGLTRQAGETDIRREARELMMLVRQGIARLAGTHAGEIQATNIEPDIPPALPGDSIRPQTQVFTQ